VPLPFLTKIYQSKTLGNECIAGNRKGVLFYRCC